MRIMALSATVGDKFYAPKYLSGIPFEEALDKLIELIKKTARG